MLTVRSLFMVLLVTVTMLTVSSTRATGEFTFATVIGLAIATTAVGLIVILVDALTPNKRLASVVGIYIGVAVGLVAAVGLGSLIDMVMSAWELKESEQIRIYTNMVKVVIGLIICYLTVSVVLTTKDDFRLVIPYVQFSKQRRGLRPLLVDSSVLIDGRIREVMASGFVDAPLVIPRFVLEELQRLADDADRTRRLKGRRGLDLVTELQRMPDVDLTLEEVTADGVPVDRMLLDMAQKEGMRIVTTDSNLERLGRIHGVTVLNLHRLSNAARAAAGVGDSFSITIERAGENPGQGVGHLPDGSMVVVESAASRIGETLEVTVTNVLQTPAGRLLFARPEPRRSDGTPSEAPRMAEAAVSQPRIPAPIRGRTEPSPRGRNPRR